MEGTLMALLLILALGAADPGPLVIDAGADLYPADALAQKLEGDVAVKLSVSADGALRCSAPGGGAMAPLKRASCELVAARDIFPPRVEKGQAVPADYSVIVRWKLGTSNRQFGGAVPIGRAGWIRYSDYPPIAWRQVNTGKVRIAYDITAQGRPQNCRIESTNTTQALAGNMCPLFVERAIFLPALDPDGKPRPTRGWFNLDWRWCETARCPAPDTGE
ncbi:MAG: hypothetical protein BGP17_14095 [Sphingomonas sp. 67-41]|nr:MAG: hypothetical protein BGP17_14095 [Sphingomonas sp. 67-41]